MGQDQLGLYQHLCSLRPFTLVVYYSTFFFFVLSISFVSSSTTYYSKSSVRLLSNCGQKGISETLNKLKSLNSRHRRVNKLNGKATNITFVVKTVNINKMCDRCLQTKHRKNCECCPGHYLSTSVY